MYRVEMFEVNVGVPILFSNPQQYFVLIEDTTVFVSCPELVHVDCQDQAETSRGHQLNR